VAVRAPHLYQSLRCFCLGAFSALADVDVPFAFEAHASINGPSLYEYRPLARGLVEKHARELRALPDAAIAIGDLGREPSAAIFARAHAGADPSAEQALYGSVLLPLVSAMAEACGGFDWHDDAFDRAYAELELSLFGSKRAYAAVAPLVGVSVGSQVDLGEGLRVRVAAAGELAAHWPEAQGLLPKDFGREVDRLCVIELERELEEGASEPPDAPGELADAVSALRLATAGPIAAGPVLFERLDWRPFGIRPVLPISATQPSGESTRLDSFRGRLAQDLRGWVGQADADQELAEALDRWELSLFAQEPFRSEQLRGSLAALLGAGDGFWAAALRTSVLLGETPHDREALFATLRDGDAGDAVRRALVETLAHGDRTELAAALDATLLGLRPRPQSVFAARAA